jgi:hypothetical protein
MCGKREDARLPSAEAVENECILASKPIYPHFAGQSETVPGSAGTFNLSVAFELETFRKAVIDVIKRSSCCAGKWERVKLRFEKAPDIDFTLKHHSPADESRLPAQTLLLRGAESPLGSDRPCAPRAP